MRRRQKTFSRPDEALSSIVAALSFQVEGQINLLIDLQVSRQTPLIGQQR